VQRLTGRSNSKIGMYGCMNLGPVLPVHSVWLDVAFIRTGLDDRMGISPSAVFVKAGT
jgi:hypothetical protein